ncbi:zinc finger protein 185 isoform 3-T3 [Polymixia lowei]
MSKEGDRATVFHTTMVRTKLKGDSSWMQRRSDPEPQAQEEKPWLAEVRAGRLNGAPIETSPLSSPTKVTPSPDKPATVRAPTQGYLIRGVFTKTDNKPARTSTSNGFSGTTNNIPKKPSESYKKIAPHIVRPVSESPVQIERQLSFEEQEKRREAASNVLRKSSAKQRSYVLSAAKKFDPSTPPRSTEKAPETSPVNTSPSFVAKRVVISDDDDTAETPAPASTPPSTSPTAIPVLSPGTEPEPTKDIPVENRVKTVDVDEPVAPAEENSAPEPAKEAPPLFPPKEDTSVVTPKEDPFEHMKPGCTKVAILLPEYVGEVYRVPEPDDVPVSCVPQSLVMEDVERTVPRPQLSPKSPSPTVDTHAALFDTLIPFDTSSTSPLDTQEQNDVSDPTELVPDSFKDDEPILVQEEPCPEDGHTDSVERESAPEISNCVETTEDLLALNDGPEEVAEPVPPSPGRWSQELLSGPDRFSDVAKTSDTLNLLADDIIPINTEEHSFNTEREEEKQTDKTAKDTQSPTETVTTKTVIITDRSSVEDNTDPWNSPLEFTATTVTDSSSADPFDPYPIGTTSHNSSSDLVQPPSAHPINSSTDLLSHTYREEEGQTPEISKCSNALEALADDIIPIDTDTKSLSADRSWTRAQETAAPADKSQEDAPAGHVQDQQTLVMFERKSTESGSPWDRWTLPTVYTEEEEEEEEEKEEEEGEDESPEDTETQTVTTITSVRETHGEPDPSTERYETYSTIVEREDEQRTQTPEPDSKKGFVYVKEYVNATELSLHNTTDNDHGGSDYLTSSASSYSYSSPSCSGSLSSPCTYCGEMVGNDAKITIEHLNISCHPNCFKCGVCSKPMGDLLFSMFLHDGIVHCESCYSQALD